MSIPLSAAGRRKTAYPARLIHLFGVALVALCCLSASLSHARGIPVALMADPAAQAIPPAAQAIPQGPSAATWTGIAGIVVILVNGAVTAVLGVSKTRAETRQAVAASEARLALKVFEAKEEVRREIASKAELDRQHRHEVRDHDGLVINELRGQVTANADAIASMPRRRSDRSDRSGS